MLNRTLGVWFALQMANAMGAQAAAGSNPSPAPLPLLRVAFAGRADQFTGVVDASFEVELRNNSARKIAVSASPFSLQIKSAQCADRTVPTRTRRVAYKLAPEASQAQAVRALSPGESTRFVLGSLLFYTGAKPDNVVQYLLTRGECRIIFVYRYSYRPIGAPYAPSKDLVEALVYGVVESNEVVFNVD